MRPTLHRGLVILIAAIVIACICLGEHLAPSSALALAANVLAVLANTLTLAASGRGIRRQPLP